MAQNESPTPPGTAKARLERLRVVIHGAVQGVGFRPFVYRLAKSHYLNGFVTNTPGGVLVEVEGPADALTSFLVKLESDKPQPSVIQSLEPTILEAVGFNDFSIKSSSDTGARTAAILPDLATCPDCLRDIMDPRNRRYRYAFTNCTYCGPRFSIIESLPYDRPNTVMRRFAMCAECLREYEDPEDRRFHAQPNACPICGPSLALWDESGTPIATADPILDAAAAILDGRIVALKGIGGFQLLVDAANEEAVQRLRERKHRIEKPFALMYPSLEAVLRDCIGASEMERRLLCSPQAPIVLLERGPDASIAHAVAPDNPEFGVMLPYSPLHHLLMSELNRPIVATSGNISDDPICIDEAEAPRRLGGIADLYIVHNRPIMRHVDDSVARVVLGHEMLIRRARGYAPLPVALLRPAPLILAVGAHQKSAIALAVGDQAIVSQHIGDLDTRAAYETFESVATHLCALYDCKPDSIACDLHPDYASTAYAHAAGQPILHGRQSTGCASARSRLGRQRIWGRRIRVGRRVFACDRDRLAPRRKSAPVSSAGFGNGGARAATLRRRGAPRSIRARGFRPHGYRLHRRV
jgi:hydrogenase maturation protein HypF